MSRRGEKLDVVLGSFDERLVLTQMGTAIQLTRMHPSTIALVWHLFGDGAGRGLAAGWDALPLFGESLFALEGPVMRDDEQVKSQLQNVWEEVFLPPESVGAHT